MSSIRFHHLPKPLVFALLAAIGAVAVSLFAEFLPLADQQIGKDGVSQGAPSVIGISEDMRQRLDEAGGEEGEIELALSWDNINDIDLHCIDPTGHRISHHNPDPPTGGKMDVDANRNRSVATKTPVEHIQWKAGTAPLGEYRVYVHHYERYVVGSDPTKYTVEMKWGRERKTVKGSLTHKLPSGKYPAVQPPPMSELTHIFTFENALPEPASALERIYWTALWTALLAMGSTLGLIVGQNHYLRRRLITPREALIGSSRGVGAGLIAGAISQAFFLVTGDASAAIVEIGRVLAWAILGGLLGLGMAIFVDNLRPLRGMAGGVVGGAVGALGFLIVGLLIGEVAGRPAGAAIVGFFIGGMIALVDVFFREAWLEVHYSPNEMRTVALGRKPVVIGSDRARCTIIAPGGPGIALRYTLSDGTISCEDLQASQTDVVQPGDRRSADTLDIRVCAAKPTPRQQNSASSAPITPPVPGGRKPGAPLPAASPTGHHLCIRGRRISLLVGARLLTSDFSGLETTQPDGAVAEVTTHPTDPTLLGLKNLAQLPWSVHMPDGAGKSVEPGKSVRIATGVKIDFGVLKGFIE